MGMPLPADLVELKGASARTPGAGADHDRVSPRERFRLPAFVAGRSGKNA